MDSLSPRDAVATMARNASSRSFGAKARSSSVILPALAQSWTAAVASRATTWMRAPVSIRPPILGSPTLPAPTTRQRLPSSFRNMGNRLLMVSAFHPAGHSSFGQIARDRSDGLSGKVVAQFRIAVARKKLPQIFTRVAIDEVPTQKTLDGFRNFGGEAAISDWPGNRLMETDGAAQAKVVGVRHLSVDL